MKDILLVAAAGVVLLIVVRKVTQSAAAATVKPPVYSGDVYLPIPVAADANNPFGVSFI